MRIKHLLLVLGLLLFGSSARASITLVQSNHGTTASGTSATCTLSSSVTSGNLAIIDVVWGELAAVNTDYSVTDGNTYSAAFAAPNTFTNELSMWYRKLTSNASSLTITATITGHSNHTIRLACFEYSSTTGWSTTPLDHTTTTGNSSSVATTSGNPLTITPSASGYLVHSAIDFAIVTSTNAITGGFPFTIQPAGGTVSTGWLSDGRANSADDQNSGSVQEECRYQWTNSSQWGGIIASFAPAVAGSTTNLRKPALSY